DRMKGAEGNREPVPDINHADGDGEVRDLLFGELLAHGLPRLVRHAGFGDERHRFRPLERGALAIRVERRLSPRIQKIETRLAFAGGAGLARMHLEAEGAAV